MRLRSCTKQVTQLRLGKVMVSSFLIQIKNVLYVRCHLYMCRVAEAVSCFRSSQSQSLCSLVHICWDPSLSVWRLESPLSFRNGCVVQTPFDMTLRQVSHLSFPFSWVDQVFVWKSYDFAPEELPPQSGPSWNKSTKQVVGLCFYFVPSKAHDTRACTSFLGKMFFFFTSRGSEVNCCDRRNAIVVFHHHIVEPWWCLTLLEITGLLLP